jgi:hypothetical protein
MSETLSPRRLALMTAGLVVISFLFVVTYALTQHEPKPHGLRVAFVGPDIARAGMQGGLDRVSPGAFELRSYSSAEKARQAVLDRSVYGALVLSVDRATVASDYLGKEVTASLPAGKKLNLLLTAAAAGPTAQQTINGAFSGMAAATGERVVPIDLKALPAHDSRGLSSSSLQNGLLIPGFVFAILLFIFGHGLTLGWRLGSIAAYVLGSALVAALVIDPLVGALQGHFWALFALGTLYSAAIVLATYGLECVLGFVGTGLAGIVLILVANSTAGGTSGQEFLPVVFRQIGQAFPSGAAVRAIRNTVYFDGHHITQALLVMLAWALAGLLLIGLAPLRARLASAKEAPA